MYTVQKVAWHCNGMSDFQKNGLKRCVRLICKKSTSSMVKEFRPAEWSQNISILLFLHVNTYVSHT